jgi:hypothetical protein
MRVTFVRTFGGRDRIYVARAESDAETSWSFPTYGPAPPHDLVHLVVEAALDLRPGLWGRVAAGADLGAIARAADRTTGDLAHKYAALGDLGDVLVSEAAVAAVTAPVPELAATYVAGLRAAAARLAVAARVDDYALAAARARLDEIAAQWRALGDRGALTVRWPDGAVIDVSPGRA